MFYINMISNINSSNNISTKDVALGGAVGLCVYEGAIRSSVFPRKLYQKTILDRRPVIFNNEAQHFLKLTDYIKEVSEKNTDPKFKDLLDDLKTTGNDTKGLVKKAYAIYSNPEIKSARSHSNKWINFLADAAARNDKDLKLKAILLIGQPELTDEENKFLTKFVIHPQDTDKILKSQNFQSIKDCKQISRLAQNVFLDPQLLKLVDGMMKEHDLANKGVSYNFRSPEAFCKTKIALKSKLEKQINQLSQAIENSKDLREVCKLSLKQDKLKSILKKKYKLLTDVEQGKNAFYNPSSKKAFLPVLFSEREAVFHELGHAINYNATKNSHKLINFTKTKLPQFAITTMVLSSIFLKKQEKNEQKSPIAKVRNFVKDNIFALLLIAKAPQVFEEGLASHHANKFLKGKVFASQLKNARIRHSAALGSYVLQALCVATAGKLAVLTSDKIQSAKQKTV